MKKEPAAGDVFDCCLFKPALDSLIHVSKVSAAGYTVGYCDCNKKMGDVRGYS
jgi:hypothetical protein